ncbi:MAG: hypothetical protein M1823_000040 [Watsoniomyces obsoletus]|nr:MAG: hypothetical protein M1823_000040 [Watsoniomyces obsoletus]
MTFASAAMGLAHLVARQEQEEPLDRSLCTFQTCTPELGYVPNLGGNAFFLAVFAALLPINLFLGIRHRTWGFLVGMTGGLVLEAVGYGARIRLNSKPFDYDSFIAQIVTLTIGPAFLSAAIYLSLSRIVVVYGEGFSRLRPRTYSILFISFDFLALVLQAAGGAMAATGDPGSSTQDTGVNTMIAGLAMQVFSLLLFMGLCLDFAWSARKNRSQWDPTHAALRARGIWKAFLLVIVIATFTIFIRSVYRVVELSAGFSSELARDEPSFMILEGGMLVIACVALTAVHPGIAFKEHYGTANFRLRGGPKHKNGGVTTPES